jgi:PAS domain S-box-containing protein
VTPAPTTGSETRRLAIVGLGVILAYAVAARLGFQAAFLAEQVTTIWAPTGISLAALLLSGGRLWPAVWLGALIANAGTAAPLWTAAMIACGNTLEAVVAAWFLRKDPAFDVRLRRLGDTARLIVVGAMMATTISATIGVTTLCFAAVQPWARFAELWLAWWLGDALGALVVAPVILTVARSLRDRRGRDWLEIALLVLACIAITQMVFGRALGATFGEGLLHYVVFPLVVLAAVRFGQPATALVVLGVSATTIWNTLRGAGPFASSELHRSLILLQAFMAVLAGTGLMLAAAMSDRLTGQRRRGAAYGIGETLAEATDLAQAAPAILRRVCENLEWQIGAFWLVDTNAQRLRCYAIWITPGTSAAGFERATTEMLFAPGAGLPGRVWTSARAVWIQDVVKDSNFPRAGVAAEAGVHGAIGFPVRVGDNVLGVVEFFTRDVAAPDADLLATLSTVGNQLGQFIARKRVERAMVEEQRRTRAILDTALDAVIAMDHHGVITEFNPAAERAFGYRKDEAIGRELADLIIPPSLRQQHRAGLSKHLATGEGPFLNRRVETRGYHADGHEFPIEVAIIRVSDDGPPTFTGFVRDLTARKLAEDAVHSSEERFRTLAASNSALTLYEQDRDLRYRWVFPQHPEFPDHNIGKTDDELLPPGEGQRLTALKRRVLETGVGCREEITVTLPTETRSYDLMIEPRRDSSGAIIGVSGVALDITERKRTEQLLRESEARLREADRHKDEFLAMLAHELRNPLAPIRTGLQLMRLAGDTPDAIAQVRPMMERQVGHMVRLIDDLLDVSRISSGKIHLQRTPTPLADLVNGAVEANRPAIDTAGLRIVVRLPETPPVLHVDPTRFVQVLSNLLNNAAKFTDAGGTIQVAGTVVPGAAGADELVLSVSDTGIGIPSAMLPRVFDLFTQGEHTRHGAQSGLGIGLALARRIVEMHDGQIDARSDGAGTGSVFTIRLPLAFRAAEAPGSESPTGESGVKRRVLVVDDNADAAEMLASLVRAIGGEAETAGNGLDGLQRASTFAPDVIFLDIGMPAMDGYETCRRIRREPFGEGALIVALTGWGQERDKRRAEEAGFDAHLTKPADPLDIQRLLLASGAKAADPDQEK